LKKNVSLGLKDIKLPKGVSAVIKGGKQNPVLVSVVAPVAEVAAPVEAAPAAPVKGKGKK
ncbi:MAG: 50S ribosomal protein L25, partial [Xylophilus sp.]|nr:50S ribosomal protein L25 [Burkholderiaceae bacterium]MBP8229004.1 50S ribosomal protein L25 [Xylophilus sp.]